MLQKEGINPLNVQEKPKGARANPTRALSLSGLTKSYIKKVRVALSCASSRKTYWRSLGHGPVKRTFQSAAGSEEEGPTPREHWWTEKQKAPDCL